MQIIGRNRADTDITPLYDKVWEYEARGVHIESMVYGFLNGTLGVPERKVPTTN